MIKKDKKRTLKLINSRVKLGVFKGFLNYLKNILEKETKGYSLDEVAAAESINS